MFQYGSSNGASPSLQTSSLLKSHVCIALMALSALCAFNLRLFDLLSVHFKCNPNDCFVISLYVLSFSFDFFFVRFFSHVLCVNVHSSKTGSGKHTETAKKCGKQVIVTQVLQMLIVESKIIKSIK